MTVLTALDIVKNIVGNVLISEAVTQAAEEVSKGKALWLSLSESKVFPALSIQMVQVGDNWASSKKCSTRSPMYSKTRSKPQSCA